MVANLWRHDFDRKMGWRPVHLNTLGCLRNEKLQRRKTDRLEISFDLVTFIIHSEARVEHRLLDSMEVTYK